MSDIREVKQQPPTPGLNTETSLDQEIPLWITSKKCALWRNSREADRGLDTAAAALLDRRRASESLDRRRVGKALDQHGQAAYSPNADDQRSARLQAGASALADPEAMRAHVTP